MGLSDDQWAAIELFRALVRERAVGSTGLATTVKRRLGLAGGAETLESVADEVFDDVALPTEAREHVDAAVEAAAAGRDGDALSALDPFTAVCEDEDVSLARAADERSVACVRHGDEHEDAASVLYERAGRPE